MVGMTAALAVATTGTPAGAFAFGSVVGTPNKNLVDGQVVNVTISGFGTDNGPLYVAECSPLILTAQDPSYCDQTPADVTVVNATNGAATTPFTVHTGANFHPTKPGLKCDFNDPCYIVVTDGLTLDTTQYAGFQPVTFKDTRTVTSTKVKAKKKVKAGKTLKVTATTKPKGSSTASMTGTVVFKDGHKTFATKKEKAGGKVTAKLKHIKKGKHKITVSYSGDSNFQPSTGKVKVKAKKK